jgi:hypothetical protein
MLHLMFFVILKFHLFSILNFIIHFIIIINFYRYENLIFIILSFMVIYEVIKVPYHLN